MNETWQLSSDFYQCLSREKLLHVLEAAYGVGSFRYLRQAALVWLTSYPGDLGVNLWLAKALLAEGKTQQAQTVAEKLIRLDPEFTEALELAARIQPEAAPLTGMAEWTRLLRRVRLLLQKGHVDEAFALSGQARALQANEILTAVLALQLSAARSKPAELIQRAGECLSKWPDCLQFALMLAEAQLENGEESAAVNLLHKCVVNDASAQVPLRLWGSDFEYRPLWPDPQQISFDLPIPAVVSARLGWNLLPAEIETPEEVEINVVDLPQVDTEGFLPSTDEITPSAAEDEPIFPFLQRLIEWEELQGPKGPQDPADAKDAKGEMGEAGGQVGEPEVAGQAEVQGAEGPTAGAVDLPAGWRLVGEKPDEPPAPEVSANADHDSVRQAAEMPPAAAPVIDPLRAVQEEFERIARRLKRPGLGRADGRFPTYVIMSTAGGLKNQYGAATFAVVDKELHKLAEQIRKRQGWDAVIFYPDDAESAQKLGLEQPVASLDPWKLKLALSDLDTALGKKGEMIGALLIAGGPDVVPFHLLPNPTDDLDAQIASDNPYACLDSNYFIPDWPVGRLPGEAGPDAGLLLEQVRRLVRYHSKYAALTVERRAPDFWQRVQLFLQKRSSAEHNGSLGYTAAVWRRSSAAVFRAIGEAGSLLISPPSSSGALPNGKKGLSLAYYNLHGLEDAAEWYGQRDLADATPGPDYPVALSPKDLHGKGQPADIIYSEACYGAHIQNKKEDQAMALKFLAQGSLAMIGSTSAAYGSVTTPLIGADLLGHLFWKGLKAGKTVGDSLMQARVDLVREMNKRQGYLDGEDQKTLISFILFGDPLVGASLAPAVRKNLLRPKVHPAVKTVSDHKEEGVPEPVVPGAVLQQVKQAVAEYLPGLDTAEMRVCPQISSSGKRPGAKSAADEDGRVVVTISKEVQLGYKTHHQYARVTLDPNGKMVKMVISR